MIGETFGNYRTTAKLGEGGMGAVYLAEHISIGRKVAIKVLLPEHSKRQELVDRFFNEAKTLATLRHPALVEVYDFGVHPSGSAYLVMDFLEGESLASRLERRGKLSAAESLELARQIANGLQIAHAQGIVHRDLKPDNVFVVRDAEQPDRERVKILDFGIAKLLQPGGGSKGATQTGAVLGTPHYMSPEQCRGSGTVDHRADIYSLGCILYAMLLGRPPFPYEGVGEILGAHLYEAVKPPRTLDANIPPNIEAVIMKALAKSPDERYATMKDMADELARLAGRVPGQATGAALAPTQMLDVSPAPRGTTTFSGAATATELEEPAPPAGRGKGKVIGIAAGGVAVVGAVVAVFALRTPSPPPAPPPPPVAVAPKPAEPKPAPPPEPEPPPPAAAPAPAPAAPPAPEAPPATAEPAAPPAPEPERPVKAPKRPRGPSAGAAAFQRGTAALAARNEPAALEAFRAVLREGGVSPTDRAAAESHVVALQRRIGEINVECDVDGAQVTVDGQARGVTPLRSGVLVAPGAHELVITGPGFAPARKSVSVAPGERKLLKFKVK